MQQYTDIVIWLNSNQGLLTLSIFIATILLGWASGIFSTLRQKPKFKFNIINGPTFACTFPLGKKKGNFDVHRTCISLYLNVSNVGSSPSSIERISVGYHWNISPFSLSWLKYSVGWFWLEKQAVSLEDFQIKIGESTKIYPFIFQKSGLGPGETETYLNIGQSTIGIVYFEQPDSWGGCSPKTENDKVKVKVKLVDVFGKSHKRNFSIPKVSLEQARKYNPSFGKTISTLNGETLPIDTQ